MIVTKLNEDSHDQISYLLENQQQKWKLKNNDISFSLDKISNMFARKSENL